MLDRSDSSSMSSSLKAKMRDSCRNNSHKAPGFLYASLNHSLDEKKSCPERVFQADFQDSQDYGDGPIQEQMVD